MTSEQFSLRPARGDDSGSPLGGFQFSARGVLQFCERVGTEIRERMALEPCPEVFDRVELWSIGGQERELNMAVGRIDEIPNQPAAMRSGAIEQDKQRAPKLCFERLEEFNDLFFPDRALVNAKARTPKVHPGNDREVIPVETELHHRTLAFDSPGTNPRGALRQARLVDEDDQSALAAGFFLSPGQVRFLQCSMAASSRSRARRSGFWLEKPNCPSRRQT